MLPPVISALLAFVTAFFRSQASLRLENLALRHQIAVYKQTVHRPRLCPSDRVFWSWLSRLWSDWQSVLAFVQPRKTLINNLVAGYKIDREAALEVIAKCGFKETARPQELANEDWPELLAQVKDNPKKP